MGDGAGPGTSGSWAKASDDFKDIGQVAGRVDQAFSRLGDTFSHLEDGMRKLSSVAHDGGQNFVTLLSALDSYHKAMNSAIDILPSLASGISFLGSGASAAAKQFNVLSIAMTAFLSFERILGEMTGGFDALSGGIRYTQAFFQDLATAFGGGFDEAKKLTDQIIEMQIVGATKGMGWLNRAELNETAKAMAQVGLDIQRMGDSIPSAGKNMDFISTSILQAGATGVDTAEHMAWLSDAILKAGLSSEEAFKQVAGFSMVADKTGLSVKDISSSLRGAVAGFSDMGLSADFARPLMMGFAGSLTEVGLGMKNVDTLTSKLVSSLAGLAEDYGMAHLITTLGGLDVGGVAGGGAIMSGINLQGAMLDAETSGDNSELGLKMAQAMGTMLEQFGGGVLVTNKMARSDPSRAMDHFRQQQILAGSFSMTQTEAARTIEMLKKLKQAEASGDTETAKRLAEQIAGQKEARNETFDLMKKNNAYVAASFAQSEMQTQYQAMLVRNTLGERTSEQVRAEGADMAKIRTRLMGDEAGSAERMMVAETELKEKMRIFTAGQARAPGDTRPPDTMVGSIVGKDALEGTGQMNDGQTVNARVAEVMESLTEVLGNLTEAQNESNILLGKGVQPHIWAQVPPGYKLVKLP